MLQPPTISLCMIAFNEAAAIGDAIRSCAGAVDEVIVVDNASTDNTRDIARALGAKVIEREWTHSYADARNVSITNATGDWVVALDCDERLEPESAKILRSIIAQATTEALTVLLITESPGGESVTRYTRIGQRLAIPPMVRRIHERPSRAPKSSADSPIRIRHVGYQHGPNIPKLHRYRELLELQLSETPEDHYIQLDLLHTYWILGDSRWERMMETASDGLNRAAKVPAHALIAVLLELAMLRRPSTAPKALSPTQAAELAERWYPEYLPLVVLRIRLALAKKDHAAAIKLANFILARTGAKSIDALPFKRSYVEADIHLLTGAAYVMAGQRELAINQFKIAALHPEIAEIANKNLRALGQKI
jgi:glycosyltransferase involved in cell wall biosynthesis